MDASRYLKYKDVIKNTDALVKLSSIDLPIGTLVLREANGELPLMELLGEEIFLVEEQDHVGIDETGMLAHLTKEEQGLLHAIRRVVFGQDLKLKHSKNNRKTNKEFANYLVVL